MSGYKIQNTGGIGVGIIPVWGVDVVGYINNTLGYLVNGNGGIAGQCLVSNGTSFLPGSCGNLPTVYYQYVQTNGGILAAGDVSSISRHGSRSTPTPGLNAPMSTWPRPP